MKNEYPLNASVVLSKASGFVVKASWDCRSRALNRCAHIAAVLLTLVDYTKANGHQVTISSTSKPCVWNRGKKRGKDPQPLHKAKYKSKKLSDRRVYDWDPRPKEHRGEVSKQQINNLIIDLQSASAAINKQESMWETALRFFYEDYELGKERKTVLLEQLATLEENLSPSSTCIPAGSFGAAEIPGTAGQSDSPAWFRERQFRITASKCKQACLQGKDSGEIVWKSFHWISKKLCSPKFVQTRDMKYGISEEPKAREAYTNATGNKVHTTGLWVNKTFAFLAASPDGLVTEHGKSIITEIECLKLFREMSVEELVQQCKDGKISSDVLNQQCFKVVDGKLILRESHMYYYQVQLLLLVIDFDACDFVLHSPKGQPSVQRILMDNC